MEHLEATQNSGFQLFLIFSLGGGDHYLAISSLLTTLISLGSMCISEHCSTVKAS